MKEILKKKTIEKIYTYTDKRKGHFVRQSIKGGNIGAFIQTFEPPVSQNIFKIFKEEFRIFTDRVCNKFDRHKFFLGDFRKK